MSSLQRVVFVDEGDDIDAVALRVSEYVRVGGFRCVGVTWVPAAGGGGIGSGSSGSSDSGSGSGIGTGTGMTGHRRWVLVRPGLVRPLSSLHGRRRILVFDLNRVLGIRWHDEEHQFRERVEVNLRIGRHQAVLFRPGARKLLKMLHAAGQEVWFWSTMQRGSVLSWRDALAEFVPEGRCLSGEDCPRPDVKDLSVVVRRVGGDGVRLEDVWLIDDDPDKARLHPERFIQAPPYEPRDPFDPIAVSDGGMGVLMARILGATGV